MIDQLEEPTASDRMASGHALHDRQAIALDGSPRSRSLTFTRERRAQHAAGANGDVDEDNVSWTSLLAALHDNQELLLTSVRTAKLVLGNDNSHDVKDVPQPIDLKAASIVLAKSKTRSWDLMPPDVVRPLASTTLGTLISVAHRLGMEWIDFVPREGKMRAEGLGRSFSATLMRGMGIVVEYNEESGSQLSKDYVEPWPKTSNSQKEFQGLYVPSKSADKVRAAM